MVHVRTACFLNFLMSNIYAVSFKVNWFKLPYSVLTPPHEDIPIIKTFPYEGREETG